MRTIFENVIAQKNYDLTGLLARIDRYHIEGKLSDEDREELYALARTSPAPQYDCIHEIEKLWAAIREIRGETVRPDGWPDYVPPTGAGDAYQPGDQVAYQGKRWRCLIPNCVWAPDVLPDAWEEVSID